MAEPFLHSFNFLSKWTTVFAFNNFSFPKVRTRHTKIRIKRFDVISTALKMCAFTIIVAMNRILLHKAGESTTNSSLNGLILILVIISSLSVIFVNLFVEFQYRHHIWAMISGICDIDNTVCIRLLLSFL